MLSREISHCGLYSPDLEMSTLVLMPRSCDTTLRTSSLSDSDVHQIANPLNLLDVFVGRRDYQFNKNNRLAAKSDRLLEDDT
jgi:hypothetical protein